MSLVYIDGKYYVQNDKGYTWRVLKSPKRYHFPNKPHKLVRGDVLKLGRYIFEVKDISTSAKNKDPSMDNTEIDYKQPARLPSVPSMARMTSVNTAIDYNAMEKEMDKREHMGAGGLPVNGTSSQHSNKGENCCRI